MISHGRGATSSRGPRGCLRSALEIVAFFVALLHGVCAVTEHLALSDLYLSTMGDTTWAYNTGWAAYLTDTDPCLPEPWFGVGCSGGSVTYVPTAPRAWSCFRPRDP